MNKDDYATEVVVVNSAAEQIQVEADSKWPLETGGILLGSTKGGRIRVERATGPGPKAKHGLASFSRDGNFAQTELERAWIESDGAVDYIGEWHSHTLPIGPSGRDRKSIVFIASSPEYAAPEPLLLLCMPRGVIGRRVWEIRAYCLVAGRLVERPEVGE